MIETIEVHSKNFFIRWVDIPPLSRITWNVWSGKRSISFGIYISGDEPSPGAQLSQATGPLIDRLNSAGYESLENLHRLESKEVSEGSLVLDKPKMLAFVFDNSFSIKNNKQVRFMFNIEPLTPYLTSTDDANSSRFISESNQNLAAVAAAAALNQRQSPQSSTQNQAPAQEPSAQIASLEFPVEHSNGAESLKKRNSLRGRPSESGSKRRGTMSSLNGYPSPETFGSCTSKYGSEIKNVRSRGGTTSSMPESNPIRSLDGRYITGYLQKKRRKQYQGFARRYFVLDMQTGLLNYYLNNKTNMLRGVMPIKLSEIKIDTRNSIIHLNSGMEKWSLKSNDPLAFGVWCSVLKDIHSSGLPDESDVESVADSITTDNSQNGGNISSTNVGDSTLRDPVGRINEEVVQLPKPEKLGTDLPSLNELHSLIHKIPSGHTRRNLESIYSSLLKEGSNLTKKTNVSKLLRPHMAFNRTRLSQATIVPLKKRSADFWDLLYHQVSSRNFLGICLFSILLGTLMGLVYTYVLVITLVFAAAGGYVRFTRPPVHAASKDKGFGDDDTFADVYTNDQHGKLLQTHSNGSGIIGSDEDEEDDLSDESDAEENASTPLAGVAYVPQVPRYPGTLVQGITIDEQTQKISEEKTENMMGSQLNTESSATSVFGAPSLSDKSVVASDDLSQKYDAETSLYPLPHKTVQRRKSIISPSQPPPSIISMLKKAKDLSTASAPITTNEPLSGVETVCEMFENADLLDAASKAPANSNLRVMLVAVFAVARLSSFRCKERSLRKPFTPLLGETFELVREDYGFRFLAEKVMHKPEVIATQTESPLWTVHFTSRPHTRLWAKSMQHSDTGHLRVTFPDGEGISYINPDLFMRNLLAGERYVEPVGTVVVESTAGPHLSATIEFKAGGIFSGRSEEVRISSGSLVFEGKWTEAIYNGCDIIWSTKPLVSCPVKHYGWTEFCAQLNEITPIEESYLPPNDSRLRPDLREYENQTDVENSEKTKLALEQHQRDRRKMMEESGKLHESFFFVKTNDAKGHYVLRHGKRNYWVRRQNQDWSSIPNYFE